MKIGVAFSGSGACAAAAHQFAALLQKRSIEITMLSATSLAAVPSLLWSRGVPLEEIDKQLYSETNNNDRLPLKTKKCMKLFVNYA